MNICESLTVTARLLPDQIAIEFDDHRFTYAQLNAYSAAAAEHLIRAGVRPGDRVALMLPNAPSFPVWYYGALRIGAIAVSISTRLAPAEVDFVISDCQAKAFVGSESARDAVQQALPESLSARFRVDDLTGMLTDGNEEQNTAGGIGRDANDWYVADPHDPALILYTSGTTGFPKGATLSHGNVRSNVCAFNHLCRTQPHDRVLLTVPLFHCFGQNALLNSVFNVGGTIILQKRFDLNEARHLIAKHRVTQLYGAPMMFGLLLDSCEPDDLSSVNYCFSAAATLPIQTSEAWQKKFGMPIHEGYGLTETSPFAAYNHRLRFQPGSIGMAIDAVEIRVIDPDTGRPCQPGQLGEITIRGPNVMLGYWNRPEETAAAIKAGWFHSGDIGRLDEEGYLYIVDRVKDMITIGGLKVFPAEVERVLLDHPGVLQAAVIGIPDPVLGEQVIGYLVLDATDDPRQKLAEVKQYAKQHLGNYKVPRELIAVDELPRNAAGKILKTDLRAMAAETPMTVTHDATRPAMVPATTDQRPAELRDRLAQTYDSEKRAVAIEFLQTLIQEICEIDSDPDPHDSFIDAGLDSLAMVELSSQLQLEVGPDQPLPATLLFDYPRVTDLATFLVKSFEPPIRPSPPSTLANEKHSDGPIHLHPWGRAELRTQVEQMSEEEALSELIKELD